MAIGRASQEAIWTTEGFRLVLDFAGLTPLDAGDDHHGACCWCPARASGTPFPCCVCPSPSFSERSEDDPCTREPSPPGEPEGPEELAELKACLGAVVPSQC